MCVYRGWVVCLFVCFVSGVFGAQEQKQNCVRSLISQPHLLGFHRLQAEGKSLKENLPYTRSYIKKWFEKSCEVSPEAEKYFDYQRNLYRFLSTLAPPDSSGFDLSMVGDIMWLQNGWDAFLDENVLSYLNKSKIVIGNLETPIAPSKKVPDFWPESAHYNSPPQLLQSFRRPDGSNTFTALSFSNNHTLDAGIDGALETLDVLDSLGIAHSGVQRNGEKKYVTFDKDGIRFGFYATSWGLNDPSLPTEGPNFAIQTIPGLALGVDKPLDLSPLHQVLQQMKDDEVDIKIIGVHWGSEYEMYPHPRTMKAAREMVASGADIIIGSHPHVQQPNEILFVNGYEKQLEPINTFSLNAHRMGATLQAPGRPRKALVLYSLGNFVSKMWSILSEVGVIQTIRFFRRDGVTDWSLPRHQFVYNARHFRGKRKLLLLEDYLASRVNSSLLSREEQKEIFRLLERHLYEHSLTRHEKDRLSHIGFKELSWFPVFELMRAILPNQFFDY